MIAQHAHVSQRRPDSGLCRITSWSQGEFLFDDEPSMAGRPYWWSWFTSCGCDSSHNRTRGQAQKSIMSVQANDFIAAPESDNGILMYTIDLS